MKIGFIGYGNMNQAIVNGLVSESYEIFVFNRTRTKLNENMGYQICETIQQLISSSEIIVLGVKPHLYEEILKGYNFEDKCVISIGAGVSSNLMKKYVTNFVLTMPNTGVKIKKGITAIVKSESIYFDFCVEIFEKLGSVVVVTEEQLPESIALLGSSPAYFYQFIESLAKNFENKDAEKLLAKIMLSTAQMILDSDIDAKQLKDNVCSKGGCTIEAVKVFESQKLDQISSEAVCAVIKRAKEMELN